MQRCTGIVVGFSPQRHQRGKLARVAFLPVSDCFLRPANGRVVGKELYPKSPSQISSCGLFANSTSSYLIHTLPHTHSIVARSIASPNQAPPAARQVAAQVASGAGSVTTEVLQADPLVAIAVCSSSSLFLPRLEANTMVSSGLFLTACS